MGYQRSEWANLESGEVVRLAAGGHKDAWDELHRRYSKMIARIARWEAAPDEGAQWSYYHHWLAALEDVLGDLGVVLTDDVTARAVGLARRGSGHDHAHPPSDDVMFA